MRSGAKRDKRRGLARMLLWNGACNLVRGHSKGTTKTWRLCNEGTTPLLVNENSHEEASYEQIKEISDSFLSLLFNVSQCY
jgi:hypothetical protein